MWLWVSAASAVVVVAASAARDLNSGFGNGGAVRTAIGEKTVAYGLVRQPDGKLVVAGDGSTKSDYKIALVRYDESGHLDRSFGNGGAVTTAIGAQATARALLLEPDGKLVVAGDGGSDTEYKM